MPSPDFLKSLFTADSIVMVERNGVVSWCNDSAADLLDVAPGLMPGPRFIDECGLFFPESSTPLRIAEFPLDRVFGGESIDSVEVCVRNARTGGESLWFSVGAEPVYSASSDEVEAVLVVSHDITSRLEAVQALADSNAALRALMQSSPLPILAIAVDSRITFWNRAAEDMFGWREAEVLGKPLPFITPKFKEEYTQIRRQSLAGQVIVNREIRRPRRDGELLELSLSTAPLRDRHGLLTGTICVYLNIGERRRLEEQLWQTSRLESLGILAGGVAHDFNNLLTSILGNTSLAFEDAPPGSDQAEALKNVMEAVKRAVVLTDQMLAYSGKGRFQIERIGVSELIADMAPLLQSSVGPCAALKLELVSDLPPIDADASQLKQILVNVVLNAGEAIMDSGQVVVRTGILKSLDFVFIEIIDNGCGMDAATQQRMFDPFFSTKFTGRGLGLAAVLGIVRGHNGTIDVKSAPNEGTNFSIRLPVATP